jgi:hypothetical protein
MPNRQWQRILGAEFDAAATRISRGSRGLCGEVAKYHVHHCEASYLSLLTPGAAQTCVQRRENLCPIAALSEQHL